MPRPLPNTSAKRSRAGSKRRAAGWVLLALGLLVAGVWVWSGWNNKLTWTFPGTWDVSEGQVAVCWERVPVTKVNTGYTAMTSIIVIYATPQPSSPRWSMWWRIELDGMATLRIVRLPFWPLPLLLWTTGGLALWSGRRARRRALTNHCPTCGYNLAGLAVSAPCPECGGHAA